MGKKALGPNLKKSKGKGANMGYLHIFRYATRSECILNIVAVILAMVSSLGLTTTVVILGEIIQLFINETKQDTFNQTHIYGLDTLNTGQQYSLYVICVGALWLLSAYIFVAIFFVTAERQAFRIRLNFMRSILRQDIGWFESANINFKSLVTNDLERIKLGIGEKFAICIHYSMASLIALTYSLYVNWQLTLVALCTSPIIIAINMIVSRLQDKFARKEIAAYSKAATIADEVFSAIKTVVAFGGVEKEIQRYKDSLIPARRSGFRRSAVTSFSFGVLYFCTHLNYAAAFWFGVELILGSKTFLTKHLVVIFWNVMLSSLYIGQSLPYFETLSMARSAATKIFYIIDRVPTIDSESPEGKTPTSMKGRIEFRNVFFHYPSRNEAPILKGISFVVEPGESLAVVGPSGSGKSTILGLIQRFYDASRGEVLIDGHNIKHLNIGWLRSNIGIVGQEPMLFDESIEENIKYGKINATHDEVVAASDAAHCHNFISMLPMVYNTKVGSKGDQLSAGQKQRIAIARAIIRAPHILLLDEATSALDMASEAIVQSALNEANAGRTCVMVAHRFSSIRTADKILVMKDGHIVETGTHEELISKKGLYHALWLQQGSLTIRTTEAADSSYLAEVDSVQSIESLVKTSSQKMQARALHQLEEPLVYRMPFSVKFELCRPDLHYFLVGFVCSVIMGIAIPYYGILFGSVLETLGNKNPAKIREDVGTFAFKFIFLGCITGLAGFAEIFFFSLAGENLALRIRSNMFRIIIRQNLEWFDDVSNTPSNICYRLTTDVAAIQGILGARMATIFQSLATLVAAFSFGMYIEWQVGIISCFTLPIIVVATYVESIIVQNDENEGGAGNDAQVAILALENIRTVVSFHLEKIFIQRYESSLKPPADFTSLRGNIRGLVFGVCLAYSTFAYGITIYFGIMFMKENIVFRYSDLFKIVESVLIGATVLAQAVAYAPEYRRYKISAGVVYQILHLERGHPAYTEYQPTKTLDTIRGQVEYQNVYFSYPLRPGSIVLKGFNLRISAGTRVGLVAMSGSGKSTCLQLLEGFYKPQLGHILVDNEPLEDLNMDSLRHHFSIVSQEPSLFSYSIRENIAYGDNQRTVSMSEIVEAAKQSNIHDFISNLPQGYDTEVGSGQLSGGQKQRIAIARAFIRNPKVLLLDEATSALDAESEKIVQQTIDRISAGRTCLIIASRLSNISHLDLIVVLSNGKAVERGTHQELIARRGTYYDLYMQQGLADS